MKIKQNIVHFIRNQRQKKLLKGDIDDLFESIYITIISNIHKSLGKGLSWIIDSVIDHNIKISKCNPLAGSSCIKLPKELDHPIKRFD